MEAKEKKFNQPIVESSQAAAEQKTDDTLGKKKKKEKLPKRKNKSAKLIEQIKVENQSFEQQ